MHGDWIYASCNCVCEMKLSILQDRWVFPTSSLFWFLLTDIVLGILPNYLTTGLSGLLIMPSTQLPDLLSKEKSDHLMHVSLSPSPIPFPSPRSFCLIPFWLLLDFIQAQHGLHGSSVLPQPPSLSSPQQTWCSLHPRHRSSSTPSSLVSAVFHFLIFLLVSVLWSPCSSLKTLTIWLRKSHKDMHVLLQWTVSWLNIPWLIVVSVFRAGSWK